MDILALKPTFDMCTYRIKCIKQPDTVYHESKFSQQITITDRCYMTLQQYTSECYKKGNSQQLTNYYETGHNLLLL